MSSTTAVVGRDETKPTSKGLHIMVGVKHQDGLFGEFKAGALNSQDFRLLV